MVRVWLLSAAALLLLSLGACEPLPTGGPTGPALGESEIPEIITVQTQNPRFFYLIDTQRALCFFGNRYSPQLTKVPCEELPEARELFGWDEVEEAPEAYPEGAEATGEVPEQAEPAPIAEGEKEHFEAAYLELLCTRRQPGEDGPPELAEVVARHELTPERYADLKVLLSQDVEYWKSLSAKTATACP